MRLNNLFVAAVATMFAFAACQESEQNLGTPDISINKAEMTFGQEGGEQIVTEKENDCNQLYVNNHGY